MAWVNVIHFGRDRLAAAREAAGRAAELLEDGDYEGARRAADLGIGLLEEPGAEEAGADAHRRELGRLLVRRVFARFSLSDLDGAAEDARRAHAALDGVVRTGDDPDAYDAADAQVWLAGLLAAAGRDDEVRALGCDRLDRYRAAALTTPEEAPRLAGLLGRYGGAMLAIGEYARGHERVREALEIYRAHAGGLSAEDMALFANAATTLAESLDPGPETAPEMLAAAEDAVAYWSHLAGRGAPVIDWVVYAMYLRGMGLGALDHPEAVQALVDARFVLFSFYEEDSQDAEKLAGLLTRALDGRGEDHYISRDVAVAVGRWMRIRRDAES